MTSDSNHYRSPHLFTPRDNTRRTSQEQRDTSVNIANAFAAANRVHSSHYFVRHDDENDTVGSLDIRDINEETIKNDPDINSLRRNMIPYNSYLSEESEDDIYDELEMLVNNPEEERKLRESIGDQSLISPTQQSFQSSTQYVPSTPRRIRRRSRQTIKITETDMVKEESVPFNRWIVYQLFMIFWLMREIVVLSATFVSMSIPFCLFNKKRKMVYHLISTVCMMIVVYTLYIHYPYTHTSPTDITLLYESIQSQETRLLQLQQQYEQFQLDHIIDHIQQQLQSHDSMDKQTVQDMISTAISDYHQDTLNLPDYALYSRGGRIVDHMTSSTHTHWYHSLLNIPSNHSPDNIIHPDTHIGQCWSMQGQTGYVTVLLSEPITLTAVTIDHPSRQLLSHQIDHAPKHIEILAIQDLKHSHPISIANITYDIHSTPIQTFNVVSSPAEAVSFQIHSNYGNPHSTDIYRIRVHGIIKSL